MAQFRLGVVLFLFLTGFGLNALAQDLDTSNKWRLEVSGGADSDGVIDLRVTTLAGEVFDVAVDIPDGTGENKVAKIIKKTLKKALPHDRFHIERDDGEDVLIKKRIRSKVFQFEVIGENVDGVRLHLQKE